MTMYLQCETNLGVLSITHSMEWENTIGISRKLSSKLEANLISKNKKNYQLRYHDHSVDESMLSPCGINKLMSFFIENGKCENTFCNKILEFNEDDFEKKHWEKLQNDL